MTEQEFVQHLGQFLHERTGVPVSECTADTDLVASRILDSFLVIELFFHMENLVGRALDVSDFSLDSIGSPRRIYERYMTQSQETRDDNRGLEIQQGS